MKNQIVGDSFLEKSSSYDHMLSPNQFYKSHLPSSSSSSSSSSIYALNA